VDWSEPKKGSVEKVSVVKSIETPIGHGKRLIDDMIESGVLSRGSRNIQQPHENVSVSNQVEMCPYTEYDPEDGETYKCRLPVHSKKVKCVRGDRV
jgi:hypothetical protein